MFHYCFFLLPFFISWCSVRTRKNFLFPRNKLKQRPERKWRNRRHFAVFDFFVPLPLLLRSSTEIEFFRIPAVDSFPPWRTGPAVMIDPKSNENLKNLKLLVLRPTTSSDGTNQVAGTAFAHIGPWQPRRPDPIYSNFTTHLQLVSSNKKAIQ